METKERYIALDTETTGMESADHRIIQIACVEIINRQITDNDYCKLINPERKSDVEAIRVHKIQDKDLVDKPKFGELWEELKTYLDGSTVIIHNAGFDLDFLDAELRRLSLGGFKDETQCEVIDTLSIARREYPGVSNSLDALCERFNISLADRSEGHRADVDARLLASVYLALTGGQETLDLAATAGGANNADWGNVPIVVHKASDEELRAHNDFMEQIAPKNTP